MIKDLQATPASPKSNINMYKWLLILCLMVCSWDTYAKSVPVKKPVVVKVHKPVIMVYDTIKPAVRSFDKHALSEYRKEPAFDYVERANKPKNAWDKFWEWFWEWLAKLFQGSGQKAGQDDNTAFRYLVIALAVVLVLFIGIKYVGADILKAIGGGNDKVDVPYQESLENIHEINFDEDIENALSQRNYKLAVRLLYLRSLKQLNDAGLINWQIEKTNAAYVDELTNADQRQTFSVLTRQFEYVWYGNFPVDEQAFKNINVLFQDFKKIMA